MKGHDMKRNKRTHNPKKISMPSKSIDDALGQKNTLELALCHVAELIGLAQDIANDMHSAMANPEIIFHVSGRIATLMHCAKQELEKAQQAATVSDSI